MRSALFEDLRPGGVCYGKGGSRTVILLRGDYVTWEGIRDRGLVGRGRAIYDSHKKTWNRWAANARQVEEDHSER